MPSLDLIFAAGPILLLIFWMTKKRPIPSAKALPLAAGVAYVIALAWFAQDFQLVHASVIAGLLMALTPILIVWSAIFFFHTMEETGAMETIRSWLNHLSGNRVAQVVIIAWSFQFLIEGASGFGTPAALAAPLLVGLGFPALRVAAACLILNSVPVSFGAVGTPVWFGFGQLGLSSGELQEIAWKTSLIHSVAACIVPLLALRLLLDWQEIRRNIFFIYLAIAASVAPMFLFSLINSEFPSVAGGLIGLLITVWLARRGIGLTRENKPEGNPPPARTVLKALFPIWATVLILLITRIPQLGIREILSASAPAWRLPLGSFGDFAISRSLVISLSDILGTPTNWSHPLLFVPSIIPFIAVALISIPVLGASWKIPYKVMRESNQRIRRPVCALFGALVLVKLLMAGDATSPVMIIGQNLSLVAGNAWPLFAAFLGGLGSFFAGSATISNLTFGPIQQSISKELHLDQTTILALQSVGAAMGNMIAIHNIVAVSSVLNLADQEGAILRKTILPMLLYGLIAALVGGLMVALS